jgi:choline monooxygenase
MAEFDKFAGYDPNAPLAEAWTIPSSWYVDPRMLELERQTVFARSWQLVGRVEQVERPGQYVTWDLAGEPLVVVRGNDGALRGFFNVCRHHAAAVMTEAEGDAQHLQCPYHGWTYSLEGELKSAPDLGAVRNFDRLAMGLVPVETAVWEKWVFVNLNGGTASLDGFPELASLNLSASHWVERRRYTLECNWKVFVDNYLDGGYHVPHLHHRLNDALDYESYKIENHERFCLQWSPIVKDKPGDRALYYWIYPNFMINWYEGVMDTNLVLPRGVNQTEVVFDFYFTGPSDAASVASSERIQEEDMAICKSVQRGLGSRSYTAGRLSARREAGEHLFHRLLYAELNSPVRPV